MHDVDYHRQNYAWFAQDDIRVTPKLTLNLGLRYEIFTTVKARFNQLANFDFADDSLVVPKGQDAVLTPTLASLIPIQRTGTPGLISPDLTNFAPRLGLAYQITSKTGFACGLWNLLRRRGEWSIFQSESWFQSAVLRNPGVYNPVLFTSGES